MGELDGLLEEMTADELTLARPGEWSLGDGQRLLRDEAARDEDRRRAAARRLGGIAERGVMEVRW